MGLKQGIRRVGVMNKMASSGVSLVEDDYFPGKYEDMYAKPQTDCSIVPTTASPILHLNLISIITICHVVHILLNHRRRNSILNASLVGLSCFECNFRVLAQK